MALESNIIAAHAAKQSAKGSPVTMTTGTKSERWVGGDMQTNRADGSENFSDNTLFGDTVDFVNTLVGNGSPVFQGQSDVIAYEAWLAAGQETVTGGVNAVQTITVTGVPTGGTFTLSYVIASGPYAGTYTTAPIAFGATASAVATAVQTIIPTGANATVTGGGGPLPSTPVTLTFSGGLAAKPVPLLTANSAGLTGGTSPLATPTTTTPGTGFSHVATPSDSGGFYATRTKVVGKTVIHRSQFNDCRTQSLRLEGSSASKVLKVTPSFLSLDPGQIITATPSQTDSGNKPLVYTEGQGTFTIDGQVYNGQSSFAAMLSWGIQEYYGDDVVPMDVTNVNATATLEGVTILLDAAGLSRYNQQIYGTATPANGAKPVKFVPAMGSYSCTFTRIGFYTGLAEQSVKFEMASVKWSPDLNIPASPDGGAVEFPLAGEYRKLAGSPAWKITTVNQDAAYSA